MPTLFIFFGLRFFFYSNDYEPIHVHISSGKGKGEHQAKFQVIPKVELIENDGLKLQELKLAESIIEENKEIIIERWKEFFEQ